MPECALRGHLGKYLKEGRAILKLVEPRACLTGSRCKGPVAGLSLHRRPTGMEQNQQGQQGGFGQIVMGLKATTVTLALALRA